jgi:hypothetical protein
VRGKCFRQRAVGVRHDEGAVLEIAAFTKADEVEKDRFSPANFVDGSNEQDLRHAMSIIPAHLPTLGRQKIVKVTPSE